MLILTCLSNTNEPSAETSNSIFSGRIPEFSNIFAISSGKLGFVSRMVEIFMVESLVEHLRQRERMTVADQVKRDIVREFHIGDPTPLHL